ARRVGSVTGESGAPLDRRGAVVARVSPCVVGTASLDHVAHELARRPTIARSDPRGLGECSNQLVAAFTDPGVFREWLLRLVVAAPITVPADANVAGAAAAFLYGQAKP